MLKPTGPLPTDPAPEPPLSEMVGRLLDDAKAYAKAEVDLARARAERVVASYRVAVALAAGAALFGVVALVTLFVTLVLTFSSLVGPLAGGLIATALAVAIAAALGFAARKRLGGDA